MRNSEVTSFESEASFILQQSLARYYVKDCGITMSFSEQDAIIAHDRRGAPYVVREDGGEDEHHLISFTDEHNLSFCAWAQREASSPLLGLGIDVVVVSDFEGKSGELYKRVLFTEGEHTLVHESWAENENLGYAFAFGAKEASFKALAAPLRTWYDVHDEILPVEVRSFELLDWEHEVGTARHGEGTHAMKALGVSSIELCHMVWGDYAITCALALSARRGVSPSGRNTNNLSFL